MSVPWASRSIKILFLLCALGVIGFQLSPPMQWENSPILFGTRDMIAFWAGTKVFLTGGNPYLSDVVLRQQLQVMPMNEAQVFLNPPWALPIYSIFMWPAFGWARWIWCALNVAIMAVAARLSVKLFTNTNPNWQKTALSCMFLPSLMVLWMGQSTMLVMIAVVAGLFFVRRDCYYRAGLALGVSLIKPQLSAVVVLWFMLTALWAKRISLVLGVVSSLVLLVAVSLVVNPTILYSWLQADFSPLVFRTSTLATRVRLFLEFFYGEAPAWPIYGSWLCGLCLVGVLTFLPKERGCFSGDQFLFVIAAALFFAPYAWFYDYAMLLPLQVVALTSPISVKGQTQHPKLTAVMPWLPQVAVLVGSFFTLDLGAHWWYPVAAYTTMKMSVSPKSGKFAANIVITKSNVT